MHPLVAAIPGWDQLLDLIREGIVLLHGVFEPMFGAHAWGWAIIGLTLVIRVLLLPLAIKQTRSMREMQALQPKVKAIQERYKTDRSMLKSDPDKYKSQKQKMNEEVMALYKEHNVNPAAGCLPLLLQAPIFFALFRVLQAEEMAVNGSAVDFASQTFYVFSPLGEAANASIWGWGLIVAMAITMFVTQWQMQGRTQGDTATQQKVLMYAMPLFLGFVAQGLPIGVLLYWVTTNIWQLGQQQIIFYEVAHEDDDGDPSGNGKARSTKGRDAPSGGSKKASAKGSDGSKSGSKGSSNDGGSGRGASSKSSKNDKKSTEKKNGGKKKSDKNNGGKKKGGASRSDHLPRRRRSS